MKLTKSKQFLADAIHASGKGWPDGANWAAQDKTDGQCNENMICFFSGPCKPVCIGAPKMWLCGSSRSTFIGYQHSVKCTKIHPNWHQTVLSCEEYFSAYPAGPVADADADGWIEWKGGECPVSAWVEVEVKRRGEVGCCLEDEPESVNWSHYGTTGDVIAYRLHRPDADVVDAEFFPEPEPNPTIEQLAADYRNKLDYASRKQQEADDAKAAADEALGELERAGESLGLVIGIARPEPEPELVITDPLYLMVGDILRCKSIPNGAKCSVGDSGPIRKLENHPIHGGVYVNVGGKDWFGEFGEHWEFIRRP